MMSETVQHSRFVWISLVEVEGLEGNPHFDRGEKAFVNALVLADSVADAEKRLQRSLADLRFHVVSFEGTEPLASRMERFEIDPDLAELARVAEQTGMPQYDTFHSWENQG